MAVVIVACLMGGDGTGRAPTREAGALRPLTANVLFEPNEDQFPPEVRFVGRGAGARVVLTDHDATFIHQGRLEDGTPCSASVEMNFGALSPPRPGERLASVSNFFLGADPSRWRTSVPNFESVAFGGVAGERVTFHGSKQGELEYDLELPEQLDETSVTISVPNGELAIREGDLVAHTGCGDFIQPRPRAFQGGTERHADFVLKGTNSFGFVVANRGPGPLLIDPTILYSMMVPGPSLGGGRVAVDAAGHLYFATSVQGFGFPIQNGYQSSMNGFADVGIMKFAPDGSSLVWSTYLGGSDGEGPTALAVDAGENVYVAGSTGSIDYPTQNALKPNATAKYEGFVTKLDASGTSLSYSTFIGASSFAGVTALALDATGAAVIAGSTSDVDFPVTAGAFQSTSHGGQTDGFLMKLSPSGSAVVYSTYVGGSDIDNASAVAVGPDGSAVLGGITLSVDLPLANALDTSFGGFRDGFAIRVPPSGVGAAYSTYLGGSGDDRINGVATDAAGNVFVTGSTGSSDFPTLGGLGIVQAGPTDAFVTKMSPSGALLASTLLGGSGDDGAASVAVRADGEIVVAGVAGSANFPLVRPLQSTLLARDAFIARLLPSLATLTSSTLLGGVSDDAVTSIAVDGSGRLYAAGYSYAGFPTKNPLFNNPPVSGTWVAKLSPMSLSPPVATAPPLGGVTFSTTEGAGGYVYSFVTNASGGSIGATTGAYTAGSLGAKVDVIQVTDSSGLSSTAVVNVGPGLTITPTTPFTAPKASIPFSVTGGSGAGYTWALPSNNSGATLNPSTGAYVAGSTPNVTDVVTVTDSLGNTASETIHVGAGLSIQPSAPAVPPNGSVAFFATGGSGIGLVWSLTKNASGATLGPTGQYKAGSIGNAVDAVSVSDSVGNLATVNVSVGGGLAINPASPQAPPRGLIAFTATGGGKSYNWALTTNGSGGSIQGGNGIYVAGTNPMTTDVVEVADELSNLATASIVVGPGITIAPSITSVPPSSSTKLFASGGAGHDFTWELITNGSGGSIDPTSGDYLSGPNGGSLDTVRVADLLGNTASLSVFVTTIPDAGVGGDAGTPPSAPAPSGCDCRLASTGMNENGGAGVGVLLVALFVVRRRSRGRGRSWRTEV